jgi:hypothetical protein
MRAIGVSSKGHRRRHIPGKVPKYLFFWGLRPGNGKSNLYFRRYPEQQCTAFRLLKNRILRFRRWNLNSFLNQDDFFSAFYSLVFVQIQVKSKYRSAKSVAKYPLIFK